MGTSRTASKVPAAKVKPIEAKTVAPPQKPTLAAWLFPGYLAMIFLGYVLLRSSGSTTAGEELGPTRALFWAINAGTLTGFPQSIDVDKFTAFGQAVLLAMIICGSLMSLILGGTAVARILRLDRSDSEIARAVVAAEILAMTLGTFLLLFGGQRTFFQAIFLAASAFGNCGLIAGVAPDAASWQTHLVLLPLMALGGFGICVLLELFDFLRGKGRIESRHTKTVLGTAAWIYVCGTLVLIALGLWENGWTDDHDFRDLAARSAAAAVASRTGGMGLISIDNLTRPAVWIVTLLMAVGGASGGVSGGIKSTTITEIVTGVRRALSGHAVGRTFGIAACWLAIYFLLVLCGGLALLHQLPGMPADQVLLNAISAASNVGVTSQPLDPDRSVAFVLSATMLVGRIAPLMILWWMADTTRDADLVVG